MSSIFTFLGGAWWRRALSWASLVTLAFTSAPANAALDNVPATQNPHTSAIKLLELLAGLGDKASGSNKCISGQQAADIREPGPGYQNHIKNLQAETGKYVGLVGLDYCKIGGGLVGTTTELDAVNDVAIEHWNRGGLVTITCHFRNPWVEVADSQRKRDVGGSWDIRQREKLAELYNAPTTQAYINFHQDLDKIAVHLEELEGLNIPVLFRMFHEFNGRWMWWGYNTDNPNYKNDFKNLWKHTFHYLTVTKGLKNLLFVWCGSAAPSGAQLITNDFYPRPSASGQSYVDVVAFDLYQDQDKYPIAIAAYTALQTAYNHPIAWAECGRATSDPCTQYVFDNQKHMNQIKNNMPKLVYSLNWMNDYAILDQPGKCVTQTHNSEVTSKNWGTYMSHGWTLNIGDGINLHGNNPN